MTARSEKSERSFYKLNEDQFIYILEQRLNVAFREYQLLVNLKKQMEHYRDQGYLVKLYIDADTNKLLIDAKPKRKIGFTHLREDEE